MVFRPQASSGYADAHGGARSSDAPVHLRPEVLETAAHHGTLELLGGWWRMTDVVVEQREQQLLLRGSARVRGMANFSLS